VDGGVDNNVEGGLVGNNEEVLVEHIGLGLLEWTRKKNLQY